MSDNSQANGSQKYSEQNRGSNESYADYYAGMDKSMRQKIALISSYLPSSGIVADMGSGSGSGTFDLACLYPELDMVGVDINPKAVEYAAQKYRRTNLSYRAGDIATEVFEKNSLSAILNSSVLHHVTSFNGFSIEPLQQLFDAQHGELKTGGILAIRDFLIPDWPDEIDFELLQPATLFEKFCAEFTCSLFKKGEYTPKKLTSSKSGWVKYRVPKRVAVEFALRKDYISDWEVELLEEYQYYNQSRFETELSKRGFCILVSRPIYNPWIIKNRFKGQFGCFKVDSNLSLGAPPTNYFVAARKMQRAKGFRCVETSRSTISQGEFIKIKSFQNRITHETWELAYRPEDTVDFLVLHAGNDRLQVLLRQSYPRPLTCLEDHPSVDATRTDGFIAESISASLDESAFASEKQLVKHPKITALLTERAGLLASDLASIERGLEYFPSPGGVLEKISSLHVEVKNAVTTTALKDNHGLEISQSLRWIDVKQILRANQVGGLLSSRTETALYDALRRRHIKNDPWIGSDLSIPEYASELPEITPWNTLIAQKTETPVFSPSSAKGNFLNVHSSNFHIPQDSGDAELKLEWVAPTQKSCNSEAIIALIKKNGRMYIGLELRSLPAFEIRVGKSFVPTLPAWRLDKSISSLSAAETSIRERARTEFKMEIEDLEELGCPFFVSAGTTPERVSLKVATVKNTQKAENLHWIDLDEVLQNYREIIDGQLLLGLFRLSHALDIQT